MNTTTLEFVAETRLTKAEITERIIIALIAKGEICAAETEGKFKSVYAAISQATEEDNK